MSGHVGHRLSASVWTSTSPLIARRSGRPQIPLRLNKINEPGHVFFNAFSHSAHHSAPQKPRQSLLHNFITGGLFAAGFSPSVPVADKTTAACLSSIDSNLGGVSKVLDRRKLTTIRRFTPIRQIHTTRSKERFPEGKRNRSSSSKDDGGQLRGNGTRANEAAPSSSKKASKNTRNPASLTTNRNLMDRLPNISQIHRPSRDELLAAATGFWSRLKVRFKWFSIRSARPFNVDEISAFFSWVLLGHVLWIILGTTTFFSLLILAVNTVFAQGTPPLFFNGIFTDYQ